jgi:two-component system, cell cycle response regulator DivK
MLGREAREPQKPPPGIDPPRDSQHQEENMPSSPIMLVDAHAESRKLYRIILEHAGYGVREVSNGLEAIHLAHAEVPAAILMELSLPFIDGLATTEQLKSDPETALVPIIILTSVVDPASRVEADIRGCDGFLCKPCDPMALLSELSQVLRGGSPVGGNRARFGGSGDDRWRSPRMRELWSGLGRS